MEEDNKIIEENKITIEEKVKENLFKNIIGQDQAKLAMLDWYLYEQDQPLLIYASSGFGKTCFAEAMGAKTIDTTHIRGDRMNTLLQPIKMADDGDILFFDEIHAMQPKVLEGFYKIIDKGTFYDDELCMDIELPKVRFIFATNILHKLPDAFKNRCKFVELSDYTPEELSQIVHDRFKDDLSVEAINTIVKACKGVPRAALSLAKTVLAGAKTEKIDVITKDVVDNILETRLSINSSTGLTQKEYLIIQKVIEHRHLSLTAIANILKLTSNDAKRQYVEPLRAGEWLGVCPQGVIPGVKAHKYYKLFM